MAIPQAGRMQLAAPDLGDGTTSVSLMALVQGSSFHLREVEE